MNCEDIDIIDKLEKILCNFDKVYLVVDKSLYNLLEDEMNNESKMLFLKRNSENQGISREDCDKLLDLYFMYEFSDKFQILFRDERFGSIFNLVDTGILTCEELIEAVIR